MVSFIIAAAGMTLYGCAAGLCAFKAVRKTERFSVASRLFFLVAFLLHSVSIGMESVSTSGTVLEGPNVLMLASWVLSLASLFVSFSAKRPYGYLALAASTVAMLMLIAQMGSMFHGSALHANSAYEQWPALVLHILFFLAAMACFVISAAASVMQIYQQHLMRQRNARLFNLTMPALDTLNTVARRAGLVGLPLFTLGMLLGFGRYAMHHGVMIALGCPAGFAYLGPRIGLSLAVWGMFAAFVGFSYLAPHRIGSKARSVLSVCGFVCALVLMFVVAA